MPNSYDWILLHNFGHIGMSIVLTILAIGAIYLIGCVRNLTYWKRRGVAQINSFSTLGLYRKEQKPVALVYQDLYKDLSDLPFGGFYESWKPVLLIRDTELIHIILNKHFSHFQDRKSFLQSEKDSCSSHLLNLTGERWRKIRKKIVPLFQTPKNLTHLRAKIKTGINAFECYLRNVCKGSDSVNVDLYEILERLTTHISGLTAANIQTDVLNGRSSKFREMQELMCVTSWRNQWRDFFRNVCPPLNDLFGLKGHDKRIDQFFIDLVKKLDEERKNQPRNDFLQHLLDLKNQDPLVSEMVITANFFFLFTAGYSTIALTLTYALYEAASDREIWLKLREEADASADADHQLEVKHGNSQIFPFTTAFIHETLRKYSVFPSLQRQCSKDFKIPGTSIVIEKGVDIIIPIHALHHDPDYWPDPEHFKPERFLKSQPPIRGTYLPFGDGPRMCLGQKFALLELKMAIMFLVRTYDIHPTEKTPPPDELEFVARGVNLFPKDGLIMSIKRRY